MLSWAKYQSEQEKKKRSAKASRAATARWDAYHATAPSPAYPPELSADCIRITVDNLVAGVTHVILFHPGSRAGRYRIDVDGQPWKEVGWTEAMVRIRKSCKRTPLYIYN